MRVLRRCSEGEERVQGCGSGSRGVGSMGWGVGRGVEGPAGKNMERAKGPNCNFSEAHFGLFNIILGQLTKTGVVSTLLTATVGA